MTDGEAIRVFHQLCEGWLIGLSDDWWTYHGDDKPIGPFDTKGEDAG